MKRFWLLLCVLPSLVLAQVRVVEVCYDPEGADGGAEWIELMNQGDEAVNIGGWLLDADGPNLVFPDLELGPDAVLVVHVNAPAALPPVGHEIWFDGSNMGNTHGFVGLWSGESQSQEFFEDYMEYGSGGHSWESQAVGAGVWAEGDFAIDVAPGSSLLLNGQETGAAAWLEEENPLPGDDGSTVLAEPSLPGSMRLNHVWPNPFNPSCRVSFDVPMLDHVRLSVMDLLGREVRVLHDGMLPAGLHERHLDLGAAVTGPYFLVLEAGGNRDVMKILLVK